MFGVFGFGFTMLSCLIGGIYILNIKADDVVVEFIQPLFSCIILCPIIFVAGMLSDLHRFIANYRTILFRGILMTFTSFVLVSVGALFCLPALGIDTITVSDCLVIGSLFSSTNFLFCFEDIKEGRENMRYLYEIALGESVFNAATSYLLFKLIRNMDVTTLQGGTLFYFVAKFAYVVIGSTCLGILFAISMIKLTTTYISLMYPGCCVWMEGTVRLKHELAVTAVHSFLIYLSFLVYLVAMYLKLSSILAVFSYGILTSHYLLPKTTGYKITVRRMSPIMVDCVEVPLYLWLGCCVANCNHWGYVLSSWSTFGTYLAATFILFIILMLGRAPSMFHFSRNVLTKVETKEETTKAYLFNRWPVNNVELENQVIIWWSGFMPSAIAVCLALDQYEKSEEPCHAFILTAIISVVYFMSLIYCIWMSTPLKQILVRSMIKSPSDALSRDKRE